MTLLDGCIFCKIIKGAIPCHKVLETARVLAFMDIGPLSEGHVLVIPKFHGERLHSIPDEHLSELLPVVKTIAGKAFGAKGIAYNILQNNGKLANQEVDHVHFHIIPKRDAQEGLGLRWNPQKFSTEQLAATAAEIRASL